MTVFELSAGLSAVTGGIAGAVAGFQAGPLQGLAGLAIGTAAGMLSVIAVTAASGLIAFAIGGRSLDAPAEPGATKPPSRLAEFGFFLFLSPIAFAPVWVPIATYNVVLLVFGVRP